MNFLPFLIARRLYLKQNKNYTVLLTSILSKIGISISIFSLIISFSALNGFQALLKKTISSTLPHGIIQLTDESLLKWQDVIKELKIFPGIDYSEPYIITNGLLVIKNKVKPIEIKSFSNINYLKKNFSISYNNDFFKKKHYNHGIILSSSLSKDLSIKKGDWINVLFLKNKDNNLSYPIQKFSLKIIDIFQANGILDSNIGYVPFSFFKKFFHIENHINTIELHISDPFDADKIILNIAKKINIPFLAYTWTNSYKYIYHDIKKIKVIVYLSISLLVIISCFSIASISLMTISKKTQEIAILRSIGANNILIQLIFLYYGLRTIIVGNLIGLFLGIITILNSKRIMLFLEKKFQDNMLLDNFYYHCFFLLKINLSDVIIIFISTTIIGIITNWYPVRYASKINPSKILREY
ncbi:membrane component of lipoprotein export ABC transporter [Buchnera aphidicola str. Ak (Acyrthosiphon kondoi)]|uniref:Membrane component of lipoprotein export ABC transporter n=1 Tax=Buchnera aphidicola str. Ak (Acyrthosiphon kondoi) TaxID=1005090 RepID=G2LN11_9GAMM|nr:FtsX-like permease family protein [Buchnera aphidicola]AEO08649.1 membrane component of lipoprotein export ABC transporter [Buchnera aphidicola str. Ak (Acyrthosiphon kondoi)]